MSVTFSCVRTSPWLIKGLHNGCMHVLHHEVTHAPAHAYACDDLNCYVMDALRNSHLFLCTQFWLCRWFKSVKTWKCKSDASSRPSWRSPRWSSNVFLTRVHMYSAWCAATNRPKYLNPSWTYDFIWSPNSTFTAYTPSGEFLFFKVKREQAICLIEPTCQRQDFNGDHSILRTNLCPHDQDRWQNPSFIGQGQSFNILQLYFPLKGEYGDTPNVHTERISLNALFGWTQLLLLRQPVPAELARPWALRALVPSHTDTERHSIQETLPSWPAQQS